MRSIVCVREYIGYDRLTTNDDLAMLNAVYHSLEPLSAYMPRLFHANHETVK